MSSTKGNRESISEFKKRMRKKKVLEEMSRADNLLDEYEKSMSSINLYRQSTGIVYDDDMVKHKCEWDNNYPENPGRYTAIMSRMNELGLVQRCKRINITDYGNTYIDKVHNSRETLKKYCEEYVSNLQLSEQRASQYDAIFFNQESYECALLAVNATISLVRTVARSIVQNGMAIVRPPGHHAQHSDFNGYCFFNNVAIATEYLLSEENVKKVLIVDFDVHHGQGIQRKFYDNPNVLYFSIHRYEYGKFWPNLRESSFDYIGEKDGQGYNINVPLNVTGLGDSDYMAIVTSILLPIAYEPDMILFSAGYDACIGCPEGEMKVSPGFYGHLIKLLSGLANGKLAVVLEGGYFLPSLAEGAAMTLSALLDDQPAILPPLVLPHQEVITVINNLRYMLLSYWACLRAGSTDDIEQIEGAVQPVEVRYEGTEPQPPFETRNCYPVQSNSDLKKFHRIIEDYKKHYGNPKRNKVCYGYDEKMLQHACAVDKHENPFRLEAVHARFMELQLHNRCSQVQLSDGIDPIELAKNIHYPQYITKIMGKDFNIKTKSNDIFWKKHDSALSIQTAVSTLIGVVDEVMAGNYVSGVALIRPPGHHAEDNRYLGFCFINNIAVAAQHLVNHHKLERVMIIDFDIHHGNGTQKMFYRSKKVLYLSIHKYENGLFFPKNDDGSSVQVGEGDGEGFNVNVPFNKVRMEDPDYVNAFFRCVLPVAYSYAPQVVLVSAGFDAGVNDYLGNYKVSPEAFGHFIQLLRPLAGGRIILAMEGGYNLNTLKHSMNFCIKTLLGDPLPNLPTMSHGPQVEAVNTFKEVAEVQKKYWPIFEIHRNIPKPMQANSSYVGGDS